MRVEITQNTIAKELDALKEQGPAAMRDFVGDAVLTIHRTAVRGVQRGPATGRTYNKYRPRRTHQASAIGQYPQSDTGRLASSIQFELPTSAKNIVGYVGTNLMYGKYLEFKPAARGGRAWLSRAYKEVLRRGLDPLLKRAFERRSK